MPKVKGSALIPRLKYVEEHGTSDLRLKIIQELELEVRQVYEQGPLMGFWYPFKYYIQISRAIDKVMGNGDLKLIPYLGRYSADHSLKGVYKLFYKVGSPEFVIQRASRVWDQYFKNGSLEVTVIKPKHIKLIMGGFLEAHREHCLSVIGWAQRTIELSGGKNVICDETKCYHRGDAHCEVIMTWD